MPHYFIGSTLFISSGCWIWSVTFSYSYENLRSYHSHTPKHDRTPCKILVSASSVLQMGSKGRLRKGKRQYPNNLETVLGNSIRTCYEIQDSAWETLLGFVWRLIAIYVQVLGIWPRLASRLAGYSGVPNPQWVQSFFSYSATLGTGWDCTSHCRQ